MPDDKLPPLSDYKVGEDDKWVEQHPGRPTGSFTRVIECPVAWLKTLPGLRGEHKKLHVDMPKIKGMAENCVPDKKWRDEHPCELGVQHDGKVYVDDGNHRIRAAQIVKLKTYPCKIKFYGGSEEEFDIEKIIKKYAADSAQWNDVMSRYARLRAKADDQGIAGATDVMGFPGDQEYDGDESRGTDPSGENSPDKGQAQKAGPRPGNERNPFNDMVQEAASKSEQEKHPDWYDKDGKLKCGNCGKSSNDMRGRCCGDCMKKEASSNKPCAKCGAPTDSCVCISMDTPTMGNEKPKTAPGLDVRMDISKHQAHIDLTDAIYQAGLMSRVASHAEEIDIPCSELKLDPKVNYYMSNAAQEVEMLVKRYLSVYVYPGKQQFTIISIVQDGSKFTVKAIIFDQQISHVASNATNSDALHKVSSVNPHLLQKTAWKKRLTEVLGTNDETGLVKCPIEGGFLTRSCGQCPLAGNPETYIKDGYVECHFDDISSWLGNGKQIHEHPPEAK